MTPARLFEWDESYAAERLEFRAVEAPWLTVIPGRVGRIFPWGGRLLAAYTTVRSARRALEILTGDGSAGRHRR
jgi:hypothetical protein